MAVCHLVCCDIAIIIIFRREERVVTVDHLLPARRRLAVVAFDGAVEFIILH